MTTRLLKADKVAEILDVSTQRVYALTRERRIPFIKLGDRQYRYSEAALSAWLEDGGSNGHSNSDLSTKKPHNADSSQIPSDVRSIDGVFAILNYALQESFVLDNSIARGRLLVSISHGFIEALKVGELEKRLEALENALKLKK